MTTWWRRKIFLQSHFLKKQFVHSPGGREGSVNYAGRGGDQRKSLYKKLFHCTVLSCQRLEIFFGIRRKGFLCLLQKIFIFFSHIFGFTSICSWKSSSFSWIKMELWYLCEIFWMRKNRICTHQSGYQSILVLWTDSVLIGRRGLAIFSREKPQHKWWYLSESLAFL